MKYYKVKVKREPRKGGGTHYVYPDGFKDLRFFEIYYESRGEPEAVEARPNRSYEYVLIEATDDEVVNIPDAEEVDEKTRVELKGKWSPKKVPSEL